MKAKIVIQVISDSIINGLHGFTHNLKRLVIEEAGNLAIALYDDKIFILTDFKINSGCQVIGEVEVPDELVAKALAFVSAREELNSLKSEIKVLTG